MNRKLLVVTALGFTLTACIPSNQPPLPQVNDYVGPPAPTQTAPQQPEQQGMDATTAGLLGLAAGGVAGHLLTKESKPIYRQPQTIIINKRTTVYKTSPSRSYTKSFRSSRRGR
jgi:hypothetical protein